MDSGGQCVMMAGAPPTHALLVSSWDLLVLPVVALAQAVV